MKVRYECTRKIYTVIYKWDTAYQITDGRGKHEILIGRVL